VELLRDRGILYRMDQKLSSDDLWGRAAICAQAALAASDPQMRALLVHLGEFWLELSFHDVSQLNEASATDLAVIERLEADLLGLTLTFH
jgi:hypothetical protein